MKDLLTKPGLTEDAIAAALAETINQLRAVAQFGRDISAGIKRVYLVSCGGGLHINNGLQWWCDQIGSNLEYRSFAAADFLSIKPANALRADALVILSSKSGSTKEVLAAGEYLRQNGNGCKIVVFTQSPQAKLVPYGQKAFYTGDTPQSFHSMLMLKQAFLGGIWAQQEGWNNLEQLLASHANLPAALAGAALESQVRGRDFANSYDGNGTVYFIGSGPMQFVGKAFGNCLMEEMLNINVNVFPASHFYHSLVERFPLKAADRVILLLGNDSSRWQVEQVRKFCKERNFPVDVYDANDYKMDGIHPLIVRMFAPIVVEAALKPIAVPLSKVTKDLDKREHMGKVNFWEGCPKIEQLLP
jgi:fructoselysine-6-P-deglycase FrlB-like protein